MKAYQVVKVVEGGFGSSVHLETPLLKEVYLRQDTARKRAQELKLSDKGSGYPAPEIDYVVRPIVIK